MWFKEAEVSNWVQLQGLEGPFERVLVGSKTEFEGVSNPNHTIDRIAINKLLVSSLLSMQMSALLVDSSHTVH